MTGVLCSDHHAHCLHLVKKIARFKIEHKVCVDYIHSVHVAGLNIAGNRPQYLIGVVGMAILYLEGFGGLERGGFEAFPQMLQFLLQRLSEIIADLGVIYLSDCIKTILEEPEIPNFSWGACPQPPLDNTLYSFPPSQNPR